MGEADEGSAATGWTAFPTVIVGLGGTGVRTARRAKKLLRERLSLDLPTVRYLYIDADEGAFVNNPDLANPEESEKCFIGSDEIAPLLNDRAGHDWIFGQIPKGLDRSAYERVASRMGCGQIRAVGRVALLASVRQVRLALGQQMQEVMELTRSIETMRLRNSGITYQEGLQVYVISSLAGGTGSGTYLDVAMLARSLEQRTLLTGIFVLPDAFDDKVTDPEKDLIRANTYAALCELQALQDAPETLQLRIPTREHDGSPLALPAGKKLFDLCYLVDLKNESGRRMSKTEDVHELIARLLVYENNIVGARHRTKMINLPSVKGESPDPVSGKKRFFSSFANTVLSYPVERAVDFCAASAFQALIDTRLLGASPDAAACKAEVTTFLSQKKLNEMGDANNEVQDTLLFDSERNVTWDASLEGVTRTFAADKSARDVAGILQQKQESFLSQTLPAVGGIIDGNVKHYRGEADAKPLPLERWIDAFVGGALYTFGARRAVSLCMELASQFDTMKRKMTDERARWTSSERTSVQSELATRLQALRGISWIREKFTQQDDVLKQEAIALFNQFVNKEVRALAQQKAAEILGQAWQHVTEWKNRAETLHTDLKQLNGDLTNGINAVKAGPDYVGRSNHVLVQHVATMDEIERYYAEHTFGPDAIIAETFAGTADDTARAVAFGNALLGRGRSAIATTFLPVIERHYEKDLQAINVVTYIKEHQKPGANLHGMLKAMWDMCEPFWETQRPRAGLTYDSVSVLGRCAPKDPADAAALSQWIASFTEGGQQQPEIVDTTTAYELELVRYTHGARAYYLADARAWKSAYDSIVERGMFPLHVHKAFEKGFDDLWATDAEEPGVESFGLGMALGFIAKRGDHYFFNLEEGAEGGSSSSRYRVPFDTEAPTVFGNRQARQLPDAATFPKLVFEGAATRPDDRFLLGKGRSAARQALERDRARLELLEQALDEYRICLTPDAIKTQLRTYLDQLDAAGPPDDADSQRQVRNERRSIETYIARCK